MDVSTDDHKDISTTAINPAYEMRNLSADTPRDSSLATAINPAYGIMGQTIHNIRNVSPTVPIAQNTDVTYDIPSLPNGHTMRVTVAPPTSDVVGVAREGREEDLYEN